MPKAKKEVSLDDVQVLGEWNFTLQSDTPLFWIKSGSLDKYLLRFQVRTSCVPSTFGIVFHAEADGPGTDGCSFWIERTSRGGGKIVEKRYVLAGEALDSKPVLTRQYPDNPGDFVENVQMLLQGYTGCIFLQDRKVQIQFRLKCGKGSIAMFNSTQAPKAPRDDVSFTGVAITALRRGPLEVAGILGRRERAMLGHGNERSDNTVTRPDEEPAEAAEMTLTEAAPPEESDSQAAMEHAWKGGATSGPNGTTRPEMTASTTSPMESTAYATGSRGMTQTIGGDTKFRSGKKTNYREAFRATAPVGGTVGGTLGPMSRTTRGQGQPWARGSGTQGGWPKDRMRQSASDSVLRNSGALCGLSLKTAKSRGGASDTWVPLAKNAPKREQELMKDVYRREIEQSACKDFIAMG